MNGIVRLYPRWWRERYGGELDALLAEHPPSFRDYADLLRGALDAHLQTASRPAFTTTLTRGGRLMKALAFALVLVLAIGLAVRSHLTAGRATGPTAAAHLTAALHRTALPFGTTVTASPGQPVFCSPGTHPALTVMPSVMPLNGGLHADYGPSIFVRINGRMTELQRCDGVR
jgi:hypothetical protein